MQRVKRKEIQEVSCRPGTEENDYYWIEICEWKKLAHPILIKERGISFITYTNEFLLYHAEIIPELFLKSPEEFRFLTELKRFASQTGIINDSEHMPIGFTFGAHKVLFQNGKIRLIHSGRVASQKRDQGLHPQAERRVPEADEGNRKCL